VKLVFIHTAHEKSHNRGLAKNRLRPSGLKVVPRRADCNGHNEDWENLAECEFVASDKKTLQGDDSAKKGPVE
jgi:hypothetical protein